MSFAPYICAIRLSVCIWGIILISYTHRPLVMNKMEELYKTSFRDVAELNQATQFLHENGGCTMFVATVALLLLSELSGYDPVTSSLTDLGLMQLLCSLH